MWQNMNLHTCASLGDICQVLSDLHYVDNVSSTVILLHKNLLSCYVPMCGNTSTKLSLITVGNRLRYPNEFPAWVLKYERDPLLWIPGTDGMSLVMKISGAIGLLSFVVLSKLGLARPLRAMSGIETQTTTALCLVTNVHYVPFWRHSCFGEVSLHSMQPLLLGLKSTISVKLLLMTT